MEPSEILMSRGSGGGNTNGNPGEGFIDRSKVRILLCDNDTKSSEEVFNLLCKCSYQVTSARSPRQVIDALNAEGPDIDIILSEVDLPMAKGFKMLKYIMRDKDLRRIPVIMMSAQDEVTLVVKCLRLGAADYLVKPLRTNELLNLWTHMWRRRRMLGLAEKNIMNCEFDQVASDPSDANTTSTTLFSDDTDDKSRNPDIIPRQNESNIIAPPGPGLVNSSADRPNVPEINEQHRGKFMSGSGPKKSELRIGQSSAFFTYVKSSMVMDATVPPSLDNKLGLSKGIANAIDLTDENVPRYEGNSPQYVHMDENDPQYVHMDENGPPDAQGHYENLHTTDHSFPNSESSQKTEMQQLGNNYNYHHHHYHPNVVSGYNTYPTYPYYHLSMYQQNNNDLQNQYCPPPPAHHQMPGIPYYPVGFCLPGMQPWPSFGSSSSNNVKVNNNNNKVDRREAALLKFRKKRKERCFDKKVRYVNRKKLAERRPRVRGQFVRKINGINVDLNGQPTSNEFDEDDDDDDDEDEED